MDRRKIWEDKGGKIDGRRRTDGQGEKGKKKENKKDQLTEERKEGGRGRHLGSILPALLLTQEGDVVHQQCDSRPLAWHVQPGSESMVPLPLPPPLLPPLPLLLHTEASTYKGSLYTSADSYRRRQT